MKLMDSVAGAVCAPKYCQSNVVTASIDEVDFMRPIRSNDLVYVQARPVFTSAKSLEIEVLVEVEGLAGLREPCTHAYFTFVSLDSCDQPQAVPQLARVDAGDEERWLAGKARYEVKRADRAGAAASKRV
jgi:acyl-CoA hydrolase